MHKVTVKNAKYLFNTQLFWTKKYLNSKLLKHFNYFEDENEEILFPKFVQSTLDNRIKQ